MDEFDRILAERAKAYELNRRAEAIVGEVEAEREQQNVAMLLARREVVVPGLVSAMKLSAAKVGATIMEIGVIADLRTQTIMDMRTGLATQAFARRTKIIPLWSITRTTSAYVKGVGLHEYPHDERVSQMQYVKIGGLAVTEAGSIVAFNGEDLVNKGNDYSYIVHSHMASDNEIVRDAMPELAAGQFRNEDAVLQRWNSKLAAMIR